MGPEMRQDVWPRRLLPAALWLLFAVPGHGQDDGTVMEVFQRTEKQVEQLRETASYAENQMARTRSAIEDFTGAANSAAVVASTRQAMEEFRKTELVLEGLSDVLKNLSESLQGLPSGFGGSASEERQLEQIGIVIDSAIPRLQQFAEAGSTEALASMGLYELVREDIERQTRLKNEAQKRKENEASATTNLARLAEVLARLSNMADVAKIGNSVNRELLLAMAKQAAPDKDAAESLQRIIGDFGTPKEMVRKVETLADALNETTARLLKSLWLDGGALWPDFTPEELDEAECWLNRTTEKTCDACTDGIDNDFNGKMDAEQSVVCEMFVARNPQCVGMTRVPDLRNECRE